jgi:hypothetical protein
VKVGVVYLRGGKGVGKGKKEKRRATRIGRVRVVSKDKTFGRPGVEATK